ncbi:MAG: hypothetical protein HOQ07_05220 [Sinomonas sp.]|nr:hypothetical protein [Sinomonas sp.]
MGIARGSSAESSGRSWLPDERGVYCVTSDPALLDDCARVVAVAGASLQSAQGFAGGWPMSEPGGPLLLGSDIGDVPPRLPPDTVLVGRSSDRDRLWRRAAELGVEHVAELPYAAGWLVEFLGQRSAHAEEGTVLGVVGGCGGAGASTTAALLAAAASHQGVSTALVDGDRLGGGLELCLAEEPPGGLTWPDLAAVSGSINPAQLESSLPRLHGLAVLSWPAAGPSKPVGSAAIGGALEAARRAFELVIVDVGRGREAIEDFGWACERVLLVVPGRLRAVLAGSAVLNELPPVPIGAVVRGRLAEGLDAERLAAGVGCPLAARLPDVPAVARAAESGRLAEYARSPRIQRMARDVLEGFPKGTAGTGSTGLRRSAARRSKALRALEGAS